MVSLPQFKFCMQTLQLESNILGLFEQLFSDVKNRIHDGVEDIRSELTKAVGEASISVIVADDDDDDYDFFTEAMRSIVPNIQVQRATDGVQLMKILKDKANELPSMIFLDLNMPCKNGFESLDAIRNSEMWKNIPIIIYSTSADVEQIDRTYKGGANLYIQKPHSFADIKNIVKRVFEIGIHELALTPVKEKYLFKL